MMEEVINRKMRDFIAQKSKDKEDEDDVVFYLELHNLSNFIAGGKQIKSIINSHVTTSSPGKAVRVVTYYRPYKMSRKFSTRSRCEDVNRSSVVYSFQCPEQACNAMYYGHTTQTLSNRIKQHRYVSSSIAQHFHKDHDKAVPAVDNFAKCFDIIFSSSESIRIKIVEALKIKIDKPLINVKYDVSNTLLKLF